jgi:hypothetical protein
MRQWGGPASTARQKFQYVYLDTSIGCNEVGLPLLPGKHFNMYLDTSIGGNEVGLPLLLGKHFNMYLYLSRWPWGGPAFACWSACAWKWHGLKLCSRLHRSV